VQTLGLQRAGAARSLAAFLAECDPDVAALAAIESGDALALATRFDRDWAFGAVSLLWKKTRFAASAAQERRGVLCVDAIHGGSAIALLATHFSEGRERVRELRSARALVRKIDGDALLFVAEPHGRLGFRDLGFDSAGEGEGAELVIATRGYGVESSSAPATAPGLGAALVVRTAKA